MAQTYTTQAGDTLWSIAQQFYNDGSLWNTIYDANKQVIGNDPANLFAGKQITIPDKPGTTNPPPGSQSYTTKPGDTLWDIATQFYGDGSKWMTIYNANRHVIGDNPANLQANTTLTIPPAGTIQPPPLPGDGVTPISGANIIDSPASAYYEPTRSFHTFARSTNNTLVQHYAGQWQDLGAPPSAMSSGPGAVLRAPVSLHVCVRGADSQVYHKFHDGNAWNNGWENRGGELASAPSLASWSPGRLDIFGRGPRQNLVHTWWNANGGWGGWEDVSSQLPARNDIQFAPSTVSWGPNRIDIFAVRTGDSHLVHAWWDGSRWQGWEDMGGTLTEAPSVVSRGLNMLDVFGRGSDGQVYHLGWDGNRWSGWNGIGAVIPSAPAAAVGPMGISIFARNVSNQLIQIR